MEGNSEVSNVDDDEISDIEENGSHTSNIEAESSREFANSREKDSSTAISEDQNGSVSQQHTLTPSNEHSFDSQMDAAPSPLPSTVQVYVDKFMLEAHAKAAYKRSNSKGLFRRNRTKKNGWNEDEQYTLDELLSNTKETIPTSILRLSNENVPRAIKLFQSILKYAGDDSNTSPTSSLSASEEEQILSRILKAVLKRPDLVDEVYVQLVKQTRNAPYDSTSPDRISSSLRRTWELLHILAATAPPSKDFAAFISEYVHEQCNADGTAAEVFCRL